MTVSFSKKPLAHEFIISIALVLITFAVYWPVRRYEFINHDDPAYVFENNHVIDGFSVEGIKWAFGRVAGETTYWHPVTWMSHMADCQLFGLNAGAHHLVNVFFHALNAVLLFLLLKTLTGACWRSAVVAALFAWHPLQVDTVAWVTERKNVLSTCLWLLTLFAYWRYACEPKVGRYAVVVICFALGLMAKPMLVTVPLTLLVLDFWPLRRVRISGDASVGAGQSFAPISVVHAIVEKLPLFVLSAISGVITIVAHKQINSLVVDDHLPLTARLANAAISYVRYLGKIFWPADLAVHYPHPGAWPVGAVLGATVILLGVSALTLVAMRRRPYLLAGWLWFLITLLPVIGIIQASTQAMADRFAYVPIIGPFIMLVWLAADFISALPLRRTLLTILAFASLAACLAATRVQLGYWKDSETLFRHALAVTTNNYIAHYTLGWTLAQKGRLDEALAQFAATIKIKPDYAEAHNNSGVVLQMQGQPAAAVIECNESLRLKPIQWRAHNNLGLALQALGKGDEAIAQFRQALQLQADYPEAHNNLGKSLAEKGKLDEAVAEFLTALRFNPRYASAHFNLGAAYVLQGKPADAREHFAAALQARPGFADAHYQLGSLLLNEGKAAEAASHFSAALQSQPDYAEAHYQLAAILGGQKQITEAIGHYRAALRMKPDWVEALNNLAWILATHPDEQIRNANEAVWFAAHAVELTRTNNAGTLDTLAAAYAEAGRFAAATDAAQKAIAAAAAAGEKGLAGEIQKRLELYRTGRTFNE